MMEDLDICKKNSKSQNISKNISITNCTEKIEYFKSLKISNRNPRGCTGLDCSRC